ncbi:flagellar hook protein FlgE [Endozoicomonas sp. GU-1]|uniref:flagellar hook protein FlgE n=1 Tax=Endozoicomonas sp. GU-1 TaxID=3009078 RepID=UPI0022B571E6|nr:flagellar hook protein FlgE [Endozoicomonas sp. GU-1]WBA82491.1 flagellar hook protein FlgE [Endozoicomonas sp. GU-1]WBA85423.1 flagellar hook protein FlgE [Endozoicomonas sp. GU-1]
MSISITGMNAARSQLDIASQNLTNSETNGYKSFRAILGDVYAQAGTASVDMAGVTLLATRQEFAQGQLTQSGNAFDLGIDGKGFFVLGNNGEQLFSRAGLFTQDKEHYLVNPSGYRLRGFGVNNQGAVDTSKLVDLQVSQANRPGKATTKASATINLNASEPVINRTTVALNPSDPRTFSWYGALNIFDSLGEQHTLGSYFTKTGINRWQLEFQLDGQPVQTIRPTEELTFNSSGLLQTPADAQFSLTPPVLPSGAVLHPVAMDFSGITQFAIDSAFRPQVVDGQMAGSLNQVSFGDNGFLQGSYSNGEQYLLGQVALATFPNDNGLVVNGNNTWMSSMVSGTPLFNPSGLNGAGLIKAGFVEQSNVDLASGLSDVILAQRNFQVSAKAFQAEDVLSQTLINLT